MNTINRRRLLCAGGAVLALCGAVVALHGRASLAAAEPTRPAGTSEQAPPLPDTVALSAQALANVDLHYATAERGPAIQTVTATGVVSFNARRLARLGTPSRARVIAIDVAAGDHVRAGQRLAVLDQFDLSEVRSEVETASAAVADARTAADTAQAALQRGTELLAAGGIAQAELDRRRVTAADAQATLTARQANLDRWLGMQHRLMPVGGSSSPGRSQGTLAQSGPAATRGALVSPFDGVVDNVAASAGELVDSSSTIMTVADLSTMWVEANVPERDAPAVRVGQSVTVHIDAYPERRFTGHVIEVAAQADPNTGTVPVRCELPNPDGVLRANLFASVDITVPLSHEELLVPDAAIQDVNGHPAVFTSSGNGRFTWHAVDVGQSSHGMTQIARGLSAGTVVVADGSYWLKAAVMKSAIPNE
ncbi:cobalt-zinc-cadmium efflux system membrane fusion protein [Paraburkholderia youngii]|uniref:efflux RND transporter periplasmic adaptor subunit n=1 Tax=Paraburkholderia youngii TaxID=2782701 RepID=UPI003D2347E0